MTGVTAGQAPGGSPSPELRARVLEIVQDLVGCENEGECPTCAGRVGKILAAVAAQQPQPAPELTADGKPDVGTAWRLLGEARAALERLGDDDPVLDEGLGGGATEELHVRINLARQVLGREVCGCTECIVSLGLDPEDAQ